MDDFSDINRLEVAIRELRQEYDRYFAGLEKLQPLRQHDRVKKMLKTLKTTKSKNSAWRYKLNSVQSTLLSHEGLWERICRQIENGTYKRDKMRAERLIEQKESTAEQTEKQNHKESSGSDYKKSMIDLHSSYQQALKTIGNSKKVSIDSFNKTIEKQANAIKQKYDCKDVSFKVSVADGRVKLKVIPKK